MPKKLLIGKMNFIKRTGISADFFFVVCQNSICKAWFLPPVYPRLAVNSAHFEIRRLGYSSLEMLPAVLLLSERSQIKTSLEGISE